MSYITEKKKPSVSSWNEGEGEVAANCSIPFQFLFFPPKVLMRPDEFSDLIPRRAIRLIKGANSKMKKDSSMGLITSSSQLRLSQFSVRWPR